jgi:hypothetical protein
MTRTVDGFVVERGSTITIASEARNMDQNLTSFPPVVDCLTSTLPITGSDEGLIRSGVFQASAADSTGSAMLLFNFKPGDAGASYLVTITEVTPSGQVSTILDLPAVIPPPITRRGYTFVIV